MALIPGIGFRLVIGRKSSLPASSPCRSLVDVLPQYYLEVSAAMRGAGTDETGYAPGRPQLNGVRRMKILVAGWDSGGGVEAVQTQP